LKQQYKVAALYCRLSRDDENEGYSSSILSQKQILGQYAKQQGIQETEFFIDDGFSGTNYDRPEFNAYYAR
jgi:DNA invertase Pin-like site-specific DNA recombinase